MIWSGSKCSAIRRTISSILSVSASFLCETLTFMMHFRNFLSANYSVLTWSMVRTKSDGYNTVRPKFVIRGVLFTQLGSRANFSMNTSSKRSLNRRCFQLAIEKARSAVAGCVCHASARARFSVASAALKWKSSAASASCLAVTQPRELFAIAEQNLDVIVTSHKIRMVRPSRVFILQRTSVSPS